MTQSSMFVSSSEAWWAGWLDSFAGREPRKIINDFHADYERGYIIGNADRKWKDTK